MGSQFFRRRAVFDFENDPRWEQDYRLEQAEREAREQRNSDYKDKLRVDQSYQTTTGEGAGWGGLMGSLIGLTLAIPFTGGATAPAAGIL
jgi:uncharacterized membrane protein